MMASPQPSVPAARVAPNKKELSPRGRIPLAMDKLRAVWRSSQQASVLKWGLCGMRIWQMLEHTLALRGDYYVN